MRAFTLFNIICLVLGAVKEKVLLEIGYIFSVQWNYQQGGDDWKGMCASGYSQSPTIIPFSDPSYLTLEQGTFLRLDFEFDRSDDLQVLNNGHSILVTSNSTPTAIQIPIVDGLLHGIVGGGSKTKSNTEYVPAYFSRLEIHTPSEHSFGGFFSPMEAHMVMRVSKEDLPSCPMDFCLAVIAFRFQYTSSNRPNSFISDLLEAIGGKWPSEVNSKVSARSLVDFEDLLSSEAPSYVVYNGSLTMPPCTEYVLWHVMEEPLPVSVEQVASLEATISKVSDGTGRNSRNI